MNENQIADIWMLFKEYVDKKAIEALGERYIDLLADHGITDKQLRASIGFDETLDELSSIILIKTLSTMTAMRKITGTLTRLKNDSRFH